jgi:hypothetical protein
VGTSAVCFTHDRNSVGGGLALSSSSGGMGRASAAGTAGKAGATVAPNRNRPFSGTVTDASFYYMDQFVALANGNRAMLYVKFTGSMSRLQNRTSYPLTPLYRTHNREPNTPIIYLLLLPLQIHL